MYPVPALQGLERLVLIIVAPNPTSYEGSKVPTLLSEAAEDTLNTSSIIIFQIQAIPLA